METKVNFAFVGIFVLVLGLVLVAQALWLASGGAFQKKFDMYLAVEDESVAGLNLNAPVKFNGVPVGKVQRIWLDPGNPERVILLFAIEHGTPVKADTEAVLVTQGLTGIAYVELSGGTPGTPALAIVGDNEYPVIRTKPSLSARLENVATKALAKLDSASNAINGLLSVDNQGAFKSALADIAVVARTIAARKAVIDEVMLGAARTSANAARLTAQAGPVLAQIGQSAESLGQMGSEMAHAGRVTEKTLSSIGTDMQRFSAETLPEVERLLGELNVLAASLRRFSDQTERNPTGLLFGRHAVPEGPGELTPGDKAP